MKTRPMTLIRSFRTSLAKIRSSEDHEDHNFSYGSDKDPVEALETV